MIVSLDDPALENLPYGPGDIFVFNQGVLDSSWNSELADSLSGAKRVGEIIGIAVSVSGEINYCLEFNGSDTDENRLRWTLSSEELDAWFIHVGSDETEARFMMLED